MGQKTAPRQYGQTRRFMNEEESAIALQNFKIQRRIRFLPRGAMVAQGLPGDQDGIGCDRLTIEAHLTGQDAIAPLFPAPVGIHLGIEPQHRLTRMGRPNAIVIHPALI